jgi:hypothetical protein
MADVSKLKEKVLRDLIEFRNKYLRARDIEERAARSIRTREKRRVKGGENHTSFNAQTHAHCNNGTLQDLVEVQVIICGCGKQLSSSPLMGVSFSLLLCCDYSLAFTDTEVIVSALAFLILMTLEPSPSSTALIL